MPALVRVPRRVPWYCRAGPRTVTSPGTCSAVRSLWQYDCKTNISGGEQAIHIFLANSIQPIRLSIVWDKAGTALPLSRRGHPSSGTMQELPILQQTRSSIPPSCGTMQELPYPSADGSIHLRLSLLTRQASGRRWAKGLHQATVAAAASTGSNSTFS